MRKSVILRQIIRTNAREYAVAMQPFCIRMLAKFGIQEGYKNIKLDKNPGLVAIRCSFVTKYILLL